MFVSRNDLILRLLTKLDKKRSVSRHLDHQVALLIRPFLSIEQGFCTNDIHSQMATSQMEIRFYNLLHEGISIFAFYDGRGQS